MVLVFFVVGWVGNVWCQGWINGVVEGFFWSAANSWASVMDNHTDYSLESWEERWVGCGCRFGGIIFDELDWALVVDGRSHGRMIAVTKSTAQP